jgi:hypothetical protein
VRPVSTPDPIAETRHRRRLVITGMSTLTALAVGSAVAVESVEVW